MANAPEVHVNGRYLPADQPQVSFFDWSFQLGDGVYEVISTWQGTMLRFRRHDLPMT